MLCSITSPKKDKILSRVILFLDNTILTNVLLSTINYHAIVCLAF